MPDNPVRVKSGPQGRMKFTIPSGGHISNALPLNGRIPVALVMPDAWTDAAIGFVYALDGTDTYQPVHYDDAGDDLRLMVIKDANVTAGRTYWLPPQIWISNGYIKVQSIDPATGNAVAQAAERTIEVVLG
jgi:hypothetical protein